MGSRLGSVFRYVLTLSISLCTAMSVPSDGQTQATELPQPLSLREYFLIEHELSGIPEAVFNSQSRQVQVFDFNASHLLYLQPMFVHWSKNIKNEIDGMLVEVFVAKD